MRKSASLLNLNLNLRKLLSKIKNKNENKKKKTKKPKGSITSSNSDDSSVTTASSTVRLPTSSHIDWYTNLFNDCISSDSSDSDGDETPTKNRQHREKTNIRGKISVELEMSREKIGGDKERRYKDDRRRFEIFYTA